MNVLEILSKIAVTIHMDPFTTLDCIVQCSVSTLTAVEERRHF